MKKPQTNYKIEEKINPENFLILSVLLLIMSCILLNLFNLIFFQNHLMCYWAVHSLQTTCPLLTTEPFSFNLFLSLLLIHLGCHAANTLQLIFNNTLICKDTFKLYHCRLASTVAYVLFVVAAVLCFLPNIASKHTWQKVLGCKVTISMLLYLHILMV